MKYFTNQDFFLHNFFLFDLDNTIYSENDYLFASYEQIEIEFKVNGIGDFLKETYIKQGRAYLFNKAIAQFNLPDASLNVFLNTLRHLAPKYKFKPYPYFIPMVRILKQTGKEIFVVTNGNPIQQKNKVAKIEWQGFDESINFIYANEIAPKPSVILFEYIKQTFSIDVADAIMIGDADTDQEFAKRSGIDFLHVDNIISFYNA